MGNGVPGMYHIVPRKKHIISFQHQKNFTVEHQMAYNFQANNKN